MPSNDNAPRINSRFACIVDRQAVVLAAVISSYLFEPASYLPLFLFPAVEVSKTDEAALMSEGYVANLMGDQAGVLIGNAVARISKCDYAILVGLNGHQNSFLLLPPGLKRIEITKLSDVYPSLAPLALPRNGLLK